ncbi:hypothetical protein SAMD00019534_022170 [Acytostelium subglobosum LB1]|uniref:hypothetical protein n=1 Tax=Acytostelium subglobosum LB1 TaxID=1410327 RepID=UPI0006447CAD|nr:hypothetical protein SAMD00019534_022170 [Acytostelium subglobosum LB1]GAM19042.1 hypothetical protein SAMD00019534_022170 [Acytostelium subglobosum LB1]|eukprot:XP_012756969.1 hypothetical protein SAMD00019534_022170 [Acytostelium subglobosum LB1]
MFIEFITIEITNDGLHMYAFDASQVLFLDVNIKKTFFSDFYLKEQVRFIMKVDMLDKCFTNVKTVESIVFKYEEDKLALLFHRSGGYTSHYQVPEMILQIAEKVVPPEFKFENEVLFQSYLLQEVIQELKSFHDNNLSVKISHEALLLEANDNLVKSSISLYNGKTRDFYIIGTAAFDIEFKNSYLLKMDKVLRKLAVKECLVQFGKDLPLSMIFETHPTCTFQLFLAPMI